MSGPGTLTAAVARCDECDGTKRDKSNRRCRGCNGSGYVERWLHQWRPYEPCKGIPSCKETQ